MHQDYSYLRPPRDALNIQHSDEYIFRVRSDKRLERKIFVNVKLTDFEQQKMEELKEAFKNQKIYLPKEWNDRKSLLFLYQSDFEIPKAIELSQKHIQVITNPMFNVLTDKKLQILQTGLVYTYGRDKKYRPVVVVDLAKFKTSDDITDIIDAMNFLLTKIQEYMYVPSKIENQVVFIDINNLSLFSIPTKLVIQIIENIKLNFTSTLEKMFILNPTYIANAGWKIIRPHLHPVTQDKIKVLQKVDFDQIYELVQLDQLEQKYGGTLPDITEFWPIKTTLNTNDNLKIDEHTFRYTDQQRKDSNENYLTLLNNDDKDCQSDYQTIYDNQSKRMSKDISYHDKFENPKTNICGCESSCSIF